MDQVLGLQKLEAENQASTNYWTTITTFTLSTASYQC
ncbi:class III lanthipeptide [Radiobacillus deserti]|nr:class III lanthipeptide [Radiobacillus deserti]